MDGKGIRIDEKGIGSDFCTSLAKGPCFYCIHEATADTFTLLRLENENPF